MSFNWIMPEHQSKDELSRAAALRTEMSPRVARVGVSWMIARFVHYAPNADNINVIGESVDFGRQRLLLTCDSSFTAALLQPIQPICSLSLGKRSALKHALYHLARTLTDAMTTAAVRRLGLRSKGTEGDARLSQAFRALLQQSQLGFERAFFDLRGNLNRADSSSATVQSAFAILPVLIEGYDQVSDANIDYLPRLLSPVHRANRRHQGNQGANRSTQRLLYLVAITEEIHIMHDTECHAL